MRKRDLFIMMLLSLLTWQSTVKAQTRSLTVSDIYKSPCLTNTRSAEIKSVPTIILKKEGDSLRIELYRIVANCGTRYFKIAADMSEGKEGSPNSLSVSVKPFTPMEADCTCDFNVSYTLHGIEDNRFYLTCWWYDNLVELKDGEPLVLERIVEKVTIDGLKYYLIKTMQQAILESNKCEGELRIPAEVEYNGTVYPVTGLFRYAFCHSENMTKVFIPKTVKNLEYSSGETIHFNPFNKCANLESIEVDEENPYLCSVDGVLMNKEKTVIVKYPEGAKQSSYIMPQSVTQIQDCAFADNVYLKSLSISPNVYRIGIYAFYGYKNMTTLDIPESVHIINSGEYSSAFCESKFDSLIIRGIIDPEYMTAGLFYGLDTQTKIYVQPSEVEKFQKIYKGKVYPLLPSGEPTGIREHDKPSPATETFDLLGRSMKDKSHIGVYIQKGKKVVK